MKAAIPYKGIAIHTKPAFAGLNTFSLRRQALFTVAPGL
jgi:hypothetical protein